MAFATQGARRFPPPDNIRANGRSLRECRRIAAGTALACEGNLSEKLLVVRSGWMFRCDILEDGRRQILDFMFPEDLLTATSSGSLAHSVEAITDSEVALLPLGSLDAGFGLTLAEAMQRTLENAYASLTDAGRRSSLEAVAHFLFRMERRVTSVLGVHDDGSVEFPLTQEHIGDAIGLTSVHVCRMMRRLCRDGLIETSRNRLRIVDHERIAEIAGLPPEYDKIDEAALQAKRLRAL